MLLQAKAHTEQDSYHSWYGLVMSTFNALLGAATPTLIFLSFQSMTRCSSFDGTADSYTHHMCWEAQHARPILELGAVLECSCYK